MDAVGKMCVTLRSQSCLASAKLDAIGPVYLVWINFDIDITQHG